jgi:DNA-binding XRE family transcriptional regulator
VHLKLQINNLVDLSTVAAIQSSNRSWVKIHSARWVNIQSAITMGALLDVSAQSIYSWEAGNSSPRKQQLPKIAMLRGMSKREVSAILEKLAG